jgi:hypothetical protein
LTTTQVYLAGLQKDSIDQYNEKILSGAWWIAIILWLVPVVQDQYSPLLD